MKNKILTEPKRNPVIVWNLAKHLKIKQTNVTANGTNENNWKRTSSEVIQRLKLEFWHFVKKRCV
jgi:hypothetical protein